MTADWTDSSGPIRTGNTSKAADIARHITEYYQELLRKSGSTPAANARPYAHSFVASASPCPQPRNAARLHGGSHRCERVAGLRVLSNLPSRGQFDLLRRFESRRFEIEMPEIGAGWCLVPRVLGTRTYLVSSPPAPLPGEARALRLWCGGSWRPHPTPSRGTPQVSRCEALGMSTA